MDHLELLRRWKRDTNLCLAGLSFSRPVPREAWAEQRWCRCCGAAIFLWEFLCCRFNSKSTMYLLCMLFSSRSPYGGGVGLPFCFPFEENRKYFYFLSLCLTCVNLSSNIGIYFQEILAYIFCRNLSHVTICIYVCTAWLELCLSYINGHIFLGNFKETPLKSPP